MKSKLQLSVAALALIALAACSPKASTADSASSVEAPASAMNDMSGMSGMAMDNDAGAKTGSGVGVITAIDKTGKMVTIRHDAIPAVDWPAMTMAFKAAPPTLLDGLKVGEKIKFDVKVRGSDAEVTAVTPQ